MIRGHALWAFLVRHRMNLDVLENLAKTLILCGFTNARKITINHIVRPMSKVFTGRRKINDREAVKKLNKRLTDIIVANLVTNIDRISSIPFPAIKIINNLNRSTFDIFAPI